MITNIKLTNHIGKAPNIGIIEWRIDLIKNTERCRIISYGLSKYSLYIARMISPGLVRTASGLITFSLTWTLTIGVFVCLIILLWGVTFTYVGPMWNDLVATWNSDALFGQIKIPYMTSAPEWIKAFKISGIIALVMLSAAIAVFWFEPISKSVRAVGKCEKVSKEHPLYELVAEVCKGAGFKSVPSVYLMSSDQKNAFAISKPFRSVVIISQPLLTIDRNELAWIIAHELGHIHYGDSESSALWIAIIRIERAALHMRYWFLRLTYPVLMRIPPLRLFSTPIALFLNLTVYTSDFAIKVTHKIFRVLDSYAQRQMEYRADWYATQIIPACYGMSVLYDLGGMVEPSFDVFASHPPMEKRIERLKELA